MIKIPTKIKNIITVVFLIVAPIIGIVLMWIWTNWSRRVKITLSVIFIIFISSPFIIYPLIVQPYQVSGESMSPTLHKGQHFLGNKFIYKNSSPQRGDIVVLKSPLNLQMEMVKRIVGLPGEQIMIQNGKVYINGSILQELYLAQDTHTQEGSFLRENETVTISNGQYVVLSDNRISNVDSRDFGFIPQQHIIGKYWFRY